nr:alpha-1,2-fucosyltransferase [uncultured Capnocytophaga sp.]
MESKYYKLQYIYLQGGLGNQLYIISYAFFLKQQGYKYITLITPYIKTKGDTTDKSKRPLITQIPEMLGLKIISLGHKYNYSLLFRLPKIPLYKSLWSKIINLHLEPIDQWAVFQPNLAPQSFINVHCGYYQAHQYISNEFKQKINQIIDLLSPTPSSLPLPSTSDVAIHIRRGDFLTNGNQNTFSKIELPYYLKGLQILSQKINIGRVYIFSDDFKAIESDVKQIANIYPIVLVENQSILQDFSMLKQCSHFVLGNSTFAWWAAMLSNAQNVIVPQKPWKIAMKEMSPYPPHWISLQNEPEK